MELITMGETSEPMEAQAHIWNQIFSLVKSMSLKCAVELGIPDIIQKHGKPIPLSELIHALSIHPSKAPHVHRLMRMLIHSGFFLTEKTAENEEEEGFVLTPTCKFLLRDHPLSLSPFLLTMLDPMLTSPFNYLTKWFRNDDLISTPFSNAHGATLWEKAGQNSSVNSLFNEAMASDARLVSSVLTNKFRGVFEGVGSIVDVGGGTGTAAKAIADAFPDIKCSVLDLPHVVDGLEERDNLSYVGGNMFQAIPPADAVLLKWILHDWGDEECIKILKNCKAAISSKGKGGKVIIIDMVVDIKKGSHERIETQLFCDMGMMTLMGGKERSEKEWVKLLSEIGFSDYKIHLRAFGLRSLIELFY